MGGGCGQGLHMDLGAFEKEAATGLCPPHEAQRPRMRALAAGRPAALDVSASCRSLLLQPALRPDALPPWAVSLSVVTGATVVAGVECTSWLGHISTPFPGAGAGVGVFNV